MYRAFTSYLQIMLGTQGTFANPILPVIAPQRVLSLRANKGISELERTSKKGNKRAEICNLGFLDGLQFCELPEINLKKCQHVCAFF